MSALPIPSIGPPDRGLSPPSRATGHEGFLSDVVVELGFADRAAVDQAVSAARSPGATVAGVLVEMGAITEEQLAHARAERHGLLYVDLDVYEVDPAAANLLTPAAARQHGCVPIGFAGPRLVLAVADPADAQGAGELPALASQKTLTAVATAASIEQLIERLPLPQPAGELEAVVDPPALDVTVETAPEPPPPTVAVDEAHEEEYELRARLSKAETRLDEAVVRSREHHRELATARMEVEARTVELEVLRTKLTDAESDAIRARAEAEHAAHDARSLRSQLGTESRRRRLLEERLAKVETELFVAERAGQELHEAQQRTRAALSTPDAPPSRDPDRGSD